MLVDELVIITTWLTREVGLSGDREASVIIPRQIANAHTVFNLINTVLFIGLAGPLVALTKRIIKDRPGLPGTVIAPKYLDNNLADTPALALDRVGMEVARMGNRVHEMMGIAALEQIDTEKARRVRRTKLRLRLELDALRSHLLAQLTASSGDRVRILGLESDVAEVAKRLNDQIRLMARLILGSERARQG